jgi:energy-coupling factor transporter ATP-binding protein EcfA2
MFDKFKNNAHKNIIVDEHTFELVAAYGVRAISVSKEQSQKLTVGATFAITCHDAVIICEVDGSYDSNVENSTNVIEFELNQ